MSSQKKLHEQLWAAAEHMRANSSLYAVEACAVVLACLLVFFFSNQYFPKEWKDTTNVVVFVVGVGYTLFMGVGNFMRLQQIKKLQKELSNRRS